MVVPTFLKERQQKTEAKLSRNHQLLESAFAKSSQIQEVDVPVAAPAEEKNTYKEDIDWTRGRFTGKVEKIILTSGVIREKTFLTAKGNMIIIKRSELGIFIRLFEA